MTWNRFSIFLLKKRTSILENKLGIKPDEYGDECEKDGPLFSLAAKHSKNHLNRIIRANIIGDGEAIDTTTTDTETEKVKCPGKDFV